MRRKLDNELIYNTALGFFARYGYKKTTLEDIADALNMTGSSIYSYASSKQALYYDCISYAVDKWQESVRLAAAESSEPAEQLLLAFEEAVRYIDSDEQLQLILRNDPSIFPMFPSVDPIEELNNWAVTFIGDILRRGVECGSFRDIDTEDTALILFQIYKYFIISSYVDCSGSTLSVKKHISTIQTLIMNGLLK